MRIALAGVGIAGTSHLFDLVSDNRFDVVAVCSARQERAEQAAQTFAVPHAYDSLDALLERHRLDGIVLATPPAVTPRLLRSSIAAGLGVLVDKPAAATSEELRALLVDELARNWTGPTPRVAVAYNRRYQSHVRGARRLLAANTLGSLVDVECRWCAPFMQRYSSGDTFRRHMPYGHGVLLDTGCHVLDTLMFLGLGPLSVTAARLVAGVADADVEAHVDLIGAGGVAIAMHIDEGSDDVWRLTIRGSRGWMTLTRLGLVWSDGERTDRIAQDDLARPVDDLHRMLSGQPQHGATLAEAARCLAVIDAARGAARAARRAWIRPRAKALGRLNGSC